MHHQVRSFEHDVIIACMANWRFAFDCSSRASATFFLLLAVSVVLDRSSGERQLVRGKNESRRSRRK